MNKMEHNITIPIKKIVEDNTNTRTFYFELELNSKPGQFIMFSKPGLYQKPFGVCYEKNGEFAVTICKVGKATEEIFKLKDGDLINIQGPFGTHYDIDKAKTVALVAGGYGAGPLAFLADEAKDTEIEFIAGATCAEKILFEDRLNKMNLNLHLCTDDGSCGHKGYNTEKLEEIIKDKKIDLVCTCGPELMQQRVIEICGEHNIFCQISMERYMKCGFGICGQCTVDPLGIRMCTEGPVISEDLVKQIYEFGQYHRDATGAKIYFKK